MNLTGFLMHGNNLNILLYLNIVKCNDNLLIKERTVRTRSCSIKATLRRNKIYFYNCFITLVNIIEKIPFCIFISNEIFSEAERIGLRQII